MAYIRLVDEKEVIIYDERNCQTFGGDWGIALFDFLNLDLTEYDRLYQSLGLDFDFGVQQFNNLFKQYPKTGKHLTEHSPKTIENACNNFELDCEDNGSLLDLAMEFIFNNKDSFKEIYNHPFVGLSNTFFEGSMLASYDTTYNYDIDLKDLQQTMKELIEFCFLDTGNPKLNSLSAPKRFFYFHSTRKSQYKYSVTTHSTLICGSPIAQELQDHTFHNTDFDPKNPRDDLINKIKKEGFIGFTYECISVRDFLFWEFSTFLSNCVNIKRCAYCGQLFIAKGKYNTDCCNRIPAGKSFPCKKLMAIKRRKEKVKSSPVVYEYEKAYKRMYARVSNKKLTHEDFRVWSETAAKKRDKIAELYKESPSEDLLKEFKDFLGNR